MFKYLLILLVLFSSCDKSSGFVNPNDEKEIEEKVENQDTIAESKDDEEIDKPDSLPLVIDKEFLMYIGTYTNGGSKGIYLSSLDADSGIISKPELVATIENASFQYITSDNKQLWCASELWNGSQGEIVGFEIDSISGHLNKLKSYKSEGYGPCYVSVHESSNNVLVSNYNSGNVANIPVKANGTFNGASFSHQHEGSGPNTARQEGPHAHSIKVDLTGNYIYSADLGTDKVYVYTIENDQLHLYKEIQMHAGSGPRHLDFHPNKKAMAVVHELNSTIAIYTPDEDGCFTVFNSVISTIPEGFTNNNQCADIHYSLDGKFLYASNRGHNSIAVYSVNQETMELEIVDWTKENINWPRNFGIDPTGNYAIVANQNSNSITVYSIDKLTGKLNYTGNNLNISKPVCINLIDLNSEQ